MESNLKQRGNEKGPTSRVTARNVRRVRNARQLDLKGLSEALDQVGWPMSVAALSRLENGERRVDVDDVIALSVALNVSPLAILLPEDGEEHSEIGTGMPDRVRLDEVWAWGRGETNLLNEALESYWASQALKIDEELGEAKSMLDSDIPMARSWAKRQIVSLERRYKAATDRISELYQSRHEDDDER